MALRSIKRSVEKKRELSSGASQGNSILTERIREFFKNNPRLFKVFDGLSWDHNVKRRTLTIHTHNKVLANELILVSDKLKLFLVAERVGVSRIVID